MSDQREVQEFERVDQRGDIVGESIEVIAAGGLVGTAMAAPMEPDAAESFIRDMRSSDRPTLGAAAQAVTTASAPACAEVEAVKINVFTAMNGIVRFSLTEGCMELNWTTKAEQAASPGQTDGR